MKPVVNLLLFIRMLMAPAFALSQRKADEWGYAQGDIDRCYEANSQLGANVCMTEALSKADSEMNALYKSLSKALAEGKMLRDSQRAWLKFRDLECALKASGKDEQGSGTGFLKNACMLDLTIKRIKDLKHLDAETDCIGCPVRK